VLDTNVLLDWLVFRNPACAPLEQALATQSLGWIATEAMHTELRWVLSDRLCARWAAPAEQVLAFVVASSRLVPAPWSAGPLRCTDADDQIFIDLALAHEARWLLTRDRALLKLGRRARLRGVEICSPAVWAAGQVLPALQTAPAARAVQAMAPGLTGS
jgi:predicted nucleic acid-binding protein